MTTAERKAQRYDEVAMKFYPGEFPGIDEPLLGERCKVYVEREDGVFVPWSERNEAKADA